MKPKIMQCECGEKKGMFYVMRDTGKLMNTGGIPVPIVQYLHFDGVWREVSRYFHSKETCKILIGLSDGTIG